LFKVVIRETYETHSSQVVLFSSTTSPLNTIIRWWIDEWTTHEQLLLNLWWQIHRKTL